MWRNLTTWRIVYGLLSLVISALLLWQLNFTHWLQTDLKTLLPKEQYWSAIQHQADVIQENQLNQQIIALIGHSQSEQAFNIAQHIAKRWQQTTLFQQVDSQIQPDLAQLKADIQQLSLATLPISIRQQLLSTPELYFQQYAQQIVDPFSHTQLLPLEQDWLGLGRFVTAQTPLQGKIQWNNENGMLFIQNADKTWVLLRGTLTKNNLINPPVALLNLLNENKQYIHQQGGTDLVTGTALFAIEAKKQAEYESTLMSILGIGMTLGLLFCVFRTLRVLWLFLPIVMGVLWGNVITVLFFGHIHILTLVVGTSLIGVLIDFPLHWLSSSLFHRSWNGLQAMQRLKFTFLISLIVTLLGYGLLSFTALPVLQQTALFSGVALLSAVACTFLYLPLCFRHYQPYKRSVKWKFLQWQCPMAYQYIMGGGLAIFVLLGIYKSHWQDDIRQWVAMPTSLVEQAQQISELTGIDLGTQYFLITAKDDEQLLIRDQQLTQQLNHLQQSGKLVAFQSLNQWIMSPAQQQQFTNKLVQQIKPEDYEILAEIGLPTNQIASALHQLVTQPKIGLKQALDTALGQSWKPLYLGELTEHQVASIIKISGVKSVSELQTLADNQHIYWQDKRANLNQTFQATRNQAGWLKLCSFILAGGLLWYFFGRKNTIKMLSIPFFAIIVTIAILGWCAIPINLFVMFGLLLVSAIGIDYTAYMQTAQESTQAKQIAISLAAITTLISFLLLGISSTPAVASFGISVSIGVICSLFATFKFLK